MFAARPKRPRLLPTQTTNDSQPMDIAPDEEDILPSQENPQATSLLRAERSQMRKFISERSQRLFGNSHADPATSQILSQTVFTATSADESNGRNSYFDNVLRKCKMNSRGGVYVLDGYVFEFRSTLEDELKKGPQYPHNLQSFLNTVKYRLRDNTTCDELLDTIMIQLASAAEWPHSNQSIAKILLSIEALQKEMCDILFEKLEEFCTSNETNIKFHLVLHQFDDFLQYQNGDHLFEKIFGIMPMATIDAREGLVASMGVLVVPERQSEAMEKVMGIIPEANQLLTKKNLETFENLELEYDVMQELRLKVIEYIKSDAPKSLLPSLVHFLCNSSMRHLDGMDFILKDIRTAITWQLDQPVLREIFDDLSRYINHQKPIRDLWLRIITQISNANDVTVIDMMILIVISSAYEDYATTVETLFKRRIKSGVFSISMLQSSFKLFGFVAVANFHASLQLFENLFKDRSLNISTFGSECFKLLLQINDQVFDKDAILGRIISIACMKSVEVAFIDHNLRTNALQLLTDVKKKTKNEMRTAFYNVEKILEYGRGLTTYQFRLTISIICSLAWESPGDEVLRDQIEILVRKQITNSIDVEHKKQAIITVAQMTSYTMWEENLGFDLASSISDTDSTMYSVSQIVDANSKDMAKLISLASECIDTNPMLVTMFYDEMADALNDKSKPANQMSNRALLSWISDQFQITFQEAYVLTEIPRTMHGVDVEPKFGINFPEDNENDDPDVMNLCINIAGLLTSEYSETIFAHFNFVRALTYRRYCGNLEHINALLGCPLILPKQFESPKIFGAVSPQTCHDSYLFVINWMRTVVSGFGAFNHPMVRKKVLMRISSLVKLERTMKDEIYGAHKKEKARNNNNNSSVALVDTNMTTQLSTQAPTQVDIANATTGNLNLVTQATVRTEGGTRTTKKDKNDFAYGPVKAYRQLDTRVLDILNEQFEIKYPVPEDEIGSRLFLEEFRYIIEDAISKMESIPGTKKFRAGQSSQKIHDPEEFVKELVVFLPKILSCYNECTNYLKNRLNDAENDMECLDLYSDEVCLVKLCSGAVLHLFGALFSWTGFKMDEHREILHKIYTEFIKALDDSMDTDDEEDLSHQALATALALQPVILDLRSAVHLFHLVKALGELCNNTDAAQKLTKELLSRKWYDINGPTATSGNTNVLLDELVKGFVKNIQMKDIEAEVKQLKEEVVALKTSKDCLETYKNFNKANQHIVFRGFASALHKVIQLQSEGEVTRSDELINDWKMTFDLITVLLDIAERVETSRNWEVFLVQSHKIIKVFIKCGKALCERGLKSHATETNSMLKVIQKATRALNNLCNTSKMRKNSRITNQIPEYRKSLENMLYQIKFAYTKNGLLTKVLVLGQLKNKDLYGEEIPSQASNAAGNNEASDDDNNDNGDENPQFLEDSEASDAELSPAPAEVASRPSDNFD